MRVMNTENIYQVLDDLETFADQIGSEWMKERVAMLEAQVAQLENQLQL
jgi:polyhydroxyalkanoate synthesis regulator phasin